MYEELRGDLAAWATHFHFNDETSLLLCKAADAIEDLSKTLDEEVEINTALECNMPVWIPVTERLPDKDEKYLTVHTLNTIPQKPWIEVCRFAKNLHKVDKYEFPEKKPGFYQSDSEYGYYEVSGITHWMPLPEPPKDGDA